MGRRIGRLAVTRFLRPVGAGEAIAERDGEEE
jgi:hypothetical protein